MFGKTTVINVFSSVSFKKCDLSNPPTSKHLYRKCFLYLFREFSKLQGERLWWDFFSKVTETSAFCDSVEKSNMCMVFVPKSSFFRNFKLRAYTIQFATLLKTKS